MAKKVQPPHLDRFAHLGLLGRAGIPKEIIAAAKAAPQLVDHIITGARQTPFGEQARLQLSSKDGEWTLRLDPTQVQTLAAADASIAAAITAAKQGS